MTARLYGIDALMAEGFSRRTIRYYKEIGLLPHAVSSSPYGENYTENHLRILREIRESKAERRTLADVLDEMRERMPHAYRRVA